MKTRYVILTVALLLCLGYLAVSVLGTVSDFMYLYSNSSYETPLVVLEDGSDQISTVYADGTSAKIAIDATGVSSTYNFSLNVVDYNASLWEVTLEHFSYTDLSLVNVSVILHSNSTLSDQITVSGGNINQTGNYYNLTSNSTIHLGVTDLVENSVVGTTVLQTHLRIRVPNTTTYTLYIITFEFTCT